MNFIASLLRRRRDDAPSEPLTTSELLGLSDAAKRVGRRWLACCDDGDGAATVLAGPCGKDALEAACVAAARRGEDDDAIAVGACQALESIVLTDASPVEAPGDVEDLATLACVLKAPGDVEDLATLACVLRLFVDDDRDAATLVKTLVDALDSRLMPAAGRAVAEAVAVAYPDILRSVGAAPLALAVETLTPGLLCDALAGALPLDALVVVWNHVFAVGEPGLLRGVVACVGVARPTLLAAARQRRRDDVIAAAALAHDVVSDLCRSADAASLALEIERLRRREDVSAIFRKLQHTTADTAVPLTRAELRRRLAAFDVDGDGVLEANDALEAAHALAGAPLVSRAALLAARTGSVTVAALERAALGDDGIARRLGGVDPTGGSTAAPSVVASPASAPASPSEPPPAADALPACFSCVFAKRFAAA